MPNGDGLAQATSDVEEPLMRRPWFRRRRTWAVVLPILAVLVLLHRPLLVGFAHQFEIDDPARSDALVVLMGDLKGDRALRAAELYQQGSAPLIFLGETRDTANRCSVLRDHGVPAEAIRVMKRVNSTYEEALRTRESLASRNDVQRITVVTTSFHTARARWIFNRVLRGRGVEVRTAGARDPRFNASDWYTSRVGVRTYFWEAVKTVYYRLWY